MANCQDLGKFNDDKEGISGIETELFAKIDNEQVLLPIVLAKKMSQPHEEFGCFNILDT